MDWATSITVLCAIFSLSILASVILASGVGMITNPASLAFGNSRIVSWIQSSRMFVKFSLANDNPELYKALLLNLVSACVHTVSATWVTVFGGSLLLNYCNWVTGMVLAMFGVSKLTLYEFLVIKAGVVLWGANSDQMNWRHRIRMLAWVACVCIFVSVPAALCGSLIATDNNLIRFVILDWFVNLGFLLQFCMPIVQTLTWRENLRSPPNAANSAAAGNTSSSIINGGGTSSRLVVDQKLKNVVGRSALACGISLSGSGLMFLHWVMNSLNTNVIVLTSLCSVADSCALIYTTKSAWSRAEATKLKSSPH